MAKQAKQRSKQQTLGKTTPKPVAQTGNLNDLRRLANQGDLAAQAKLCRALNANPAIWRRLGDLATHAQLEFVRMISGGDFLMSESVRRRTAELRTELLGVFPSPLETLAVDRLIAARLHLEHVEAESQGRGRDSSGQVLVGQAAASAQSLSQCCEIVALGTHAVAARGTARRTHHKRNRHR